ncbi:MAG: phosphate propanoyltransferase [Ruminococcaceae bacterium]|nr:phosphate propanoyltransferase [Oscillospiraceae bacterium]
MNYDEKTIALAVQKALEQMQGEKTEITIGVSQRHVHLSQQDLETLFGKGFELTKQKTLMGREFASEQFVTLVGPSLRSIEKVRVLGPVRKNTQVEISRTDTFVLKVSPPVRPSGEIEGSERLVLVGPKGTVYLQQGVIIANRHIHLSPAFAQKHGIKDNDVVDVLVESIKPTKFFDVQVRVRDDFREEMHIDTDDANSAGLRNGDAVRIIRK